MAAFFTAEGRIIQRIVGNGESIGSIQEAVGKIAVILHVGGDSHLVEKTVHHRREDGLGQRGAVADGDRVELSVEASDLGFKGAVFLKKMERAGGRKLPGLPGKLYPGFQIPDFYYAEGRGSGRHL